jgi:hypothetical protein
MAMHPRLLAKVAGVGLGLAITLAAAAFGPTATTDASRATRQEFHDQMRVLWAGDHIVWTRCYIISAGTFPANLPDTAETAGRLLANQTAIGNAFKPFYGDAAGEQLTALLRTHILTAAALIDAVKSGVQADIDKASADWYANAEEIAAFLHGLNPDNWPLAAVESLLEAHLDLTAKEAVARIQGHYQDDIDAYDEVHAQVLQLADALSDGIIAEFPEKFAR